MRVLLDSIPKITYSELFAGLSGMELFTFVLMLFMLLYLFHHENFDIDAIVISMAALLLGMFLTTIFQGGVGDLIQVGSRWLYFIIAYMFFRFLLNKIALERFLLIICLTALYPFTNQAISVLAGTGSMHLGEFIRYSGTFHHVVKVANYLLFAIPAALYLMITSDRTAPKVGFLFLLALFHLGIYWSGYRTNWIALMVFWFLYAIWVSERKWLTAAIIMAVTIVFWPLAGSVIAGKLRPLLLILNDPEPLFNYQNFEYHHLLSGRIRLWSLSIHQFLTAGWGEKLFGLGVRYADNRFQLYMHNEYIAALVEHGLTGLILLLTWVTTVVFLLFRRMDANRKYVQLVLSTYMAFLVIAFGTMPFRHIEVMNYMAVYLASVAAISSVPMQRQGVETGIRNELENSG